MDRRRFLTGAWPVALAQWQGSPNQARDRPLHGRARQDHLAREILLRPSSAIRLGHHEVKRSFEQLQLVQLLIPLEELGMGAAPAAHPLFFLACPRVALEIEAGGEFSIWPEEVDPLLMLQFLHSLQRCRIERLAWSFSVWCSALLHANREEVFSIPPIEWIRERLDALQGLLDRNTGRSACC